jgi:hypothetical protein
MIDFNGLNALACPSTSRCTAVSGGNNEVTFNPTSPGGATPVQIENVRAGLNAVACPNTSYCVAASNSGQVVEIDTQTNPVGVTVDQVTGDSLHGVACGSVTQCVTVDQLSNVFVGTLPLLTASPSPKDLGTQALDTFGPAVPFTVSNPTESTITVALSSTGANPDDFIITSSTCPTTLAAGTNCTVDIRFAPSASGARSAALQNTDVFSGAQYQLASLTGTGGALPQGPAGANGANGANGTNGAAGAPGTAGPAGPAGRAGVGVRGVTCAGKLGKKNKITITCKVALTASRSRATVAIRMSRHGLLYASGHGAVHGSQATLRLRATRPLARGRYEVRILVGGAGRDTVVARTVRVR